MKTIGIVGGISWPSTIDYYKLINQRINEKLGGVSSGEIIIYSVNYADIKRMTEADQWDDIATRVISAAQKLEKAGADCLLIGANTMHKIADTIQAAINIPLINIAAVTAEAVARQQLTTVALLGTKYTMQLDFYKAKLAAKNIATTIPGEDDIPFINKTIYEEMGRGIFLPETKQRYIDIIHALVQQGAQGIILGCTEIPILINQEDSPVPVFDTTSIHVNAAVKFALE